MTRSLRRTRWIRVSIAFFRYLIEKVDEASARCKKCRRCDLCKTYEFLHDLRETLVFVTEGEK